MSMNNRLDFTGRLTDDCKKEGSGSAERIIFSVALNKRYKDKSGEYKEKTVYHNNITLFLNGSQKIADLFKKGRKVRIIAELEYYEKEIGESTYRLPSITVNEFEFLESLKKEETEK